MIDCFMVQQTSLVKSVSLCLFSRAYCFSLSFEHCS